MSSIIDLEKKLDSSDKTVRLSALKELTIMERSGALPAPAETKFVNNHIHTTYSFSPYSPTAALYYARKAGLRTAGIMDHDSVSGCEEFNLAGEIAGISTTCGFECRVKMHNTSLCGMRINNPDQNSLAYVALHGIPHQNIALCEEFLAPFRAKRGVRNKLMTEKLSAIIAPFGLALDYEHDVVPLSRSAEGGSVTERHILFALALKLVALYGKGQKLIDFLKNELKLNMETKIESFLCDSSNIYYEYDLLGALKSEFISQFYIDAFDECPDVTEFIAFAKKIGGISAYAYLGDVEDSATGDKKSQKFEDSYLDQLFDVLKGLDFNAITYMPSRNTTAQLERIIELCKNFEFFQISGEDINTPRQSFICKALEEERFSHLNYATYVLIGHEKAATLDPENAMFSKKTIIDCPDLTKRAQRYYK